LTQYFWLPTVAKGPVRASRSSRIRTSGCFEVPAECGHLGRGRAASAAHRALVYRRWSCVYRVQQQSLVITVLHRIQKLMVVVGSALLVALGAGASYRPFW